MTPAEALTTLQATVLLGVKPATLYSYVSRGLIRSEAGPPGTRERRYNADDVQALVNRQSVKRDPASTIDGAVQQAVGGALNWGAPVLDSALTRIADGRLSYRGQDAVQLAATATVEEVAALLWTGDGAGWAQLPMRARLNLSAQSGTGQSGSGQPRAALPAEVFAYALTHAGTHDVAALDTRPEALPAQAARVLNLLYATLERFQGVPPAPDLPLHARLARAWGVGDGADVLRRALVLLADHELNVSTFTARVAASGGASLHHATLAALCALQGPKHGLAALDAYDLISHAGRDGTRASLRDATRRLRQPPGFGHRLYPAGDPRARALMTALQEQFPHHDGLKVALELQQVALEETGQHINIDLALAALTHALDRRADDTVALFALARAVGWLAHILETLTTGQLIRPRARYVGL